MSPSVLNDEGSRSREKKLRKRENDERVERGKLKDKSLLFFSRFRPGRRERREEQSERKRDAKRKQSSEIEFSSFLPNFGKLRPEER